MSTGSPDARGLVAPEAREALDTLRRATGFYESVIKSGESFTETVMAVTTEALAAGSDLEAELERLAAEVERLAADDVRRVPPLVRQTLERALRLDMTEPPVTNAEIRAALDLLPPSPSFYESVTGMEQLAAAEAEVKRLRGALEELLCVAERTRSGDPTLNPEEWYAIRDYCRVLLAGDTGEAGT